MDFTCIRFERERIGRVCLVTNGRITAESGMGCPTVPNSSLSYRNAASATVSPASTLPPASLYSPA